MTASLEKLKKFSALKWEFRDVKEPLLNTYRKAYQRECDHYKLKNDLHADDADLFKFLEAWYERQLRRIDDDEEVGTVLTTSTMLAGKDAGKIAAAAVAPVVKGILMKTTPAKIVRQLLKLDMTTKDVRPPDFMMLKTTESFWTNESYSPEFRLEIHKQGIMTAGLMPTDDVYGADLDQAMMEWEDLYYNTAAKVAHEQGLKLQLERSKKTTGTALPTFPNGGIQPTPYELRKGVIYLEFRQFQREIFRYVETHHIRRDKLDGLLETQMTTLHFKHQISNAVKDGRDPMDYLQHICTPEDYGAFWMKKFQELDVQETGVDNLFSLVKSYVGWYAEDTGSKMDVTTLWTYIKAAFPDFVNQKMREHQYDKVRSYQDIWDTQEKYDSLYRDRPKQRPDRGERFEEKKENRRNREQPTNQSAATTSSTKFVPIPGSYEKNGKKYCKICSGNLYDNKECRKDHSQVYCIICKAPGHIK